MLVNRETCFDLSLVEYGGHVRPTGSRWGIPRAVAFIYDYALEDLDVEKAKEIYLEHYWDRLFCSLLPIGLDYFVFDSALACEPATVFNWIKMVVSDHRSNSVMDMGTIAMVNRFPGRPEGLISGIELYRRRRHKTEPGWVTHAPQWTNRCTRVRERSLKMLKEASVAA